MERIKMTEANIRDLQMRRSSLMTQLAQASESLRKAKDEGDVSDNAGVDAARALLDRLQLELQDVLSQIESAEIVTARASTDRVELLSTVTIEDLNHGGKWTLQIVPEKQDTPPATISKSSLLGSNLLGKRTGETIAYRNKRMERESFRIVQIA